LLRTKVDRGLGEIPKKGDEKRKAIPGLTCLEMTSGDSGVNFETSMSMFGTTSTSSSSSDSDSS
jgi:hypothetical protein